MIWLLMAALLLAIPHNASAEFFVVPFMGVKFGGGTSIVDLEFAADNTKFTLGGAIMNIDDGLLGYEASFGYVLGYFEGDNRANDPFVASGSFVIDGTASVIFSAPPRWTGYGLRPYAQAGAGLVHAQAVDTFRCFPGSPHDAGRSRLVWVRWVSSPTTWGSASTFGISAASA